jgi:hypothetical protein
MSDPDPLRKLTDRLVFSVEKALEGLDDLEAARTDPAARRKALAALDEAGAALVDLRHQLRELREPKRGRSR